MRIGGNHAIVKEPLQTLQLFPDLCLLMCKETTHPAGTFGNIGAASRAPLLDSKS